MKIIIYFALFLLNICVATHCFSCPNCVGRVTESTAPFFTDDFYKPVSDQDEQINTEIEEKSNPILREEAL